MPTIGMNSLVLRAGQLVPAVPPFSGSMVIDGVCSISCIFVLLYFVVFFLLGDLLDSLAASTEEFVLVLLVLVVGGLLQDRQQWTQVKRPLNRLPSMPANPVATREASLGNVEEPIASIGEEDAIACIARWQRCTEFLLINSYKPHRSFDPNHGFDERSKTRSLAQPLEQTQMGAVKLALEERLFDLPPSPQILTLADKLDCSTPLDKLSNTMKTAGTNQSGPHSPEDKMVPQPLPREEKTFPDMEVISDKNENSATCTPLGTVMRADTVCKKHWRLKNQNICKFS